MYDAGKIITGLVIFLVILTIPIWYNAAMGKADSKLDPVLPKYEKKCVESKDYMRESHMDLLNQWRDAVVRDGKQDYTSSDGKTYRMSLTGTCLKCHDDKEKFCDRCHGYVDSDPTCWDCHLEPKGVN
jgi:[DsrC]-trisulfide reductase subunit J